MGTREWHGHAAKLVRDTLLAEVEKLRATLPNTEAVRRNLAAIERATPIEKMDHIKLCSLVDLLHRSQP